MYYIWSFYINRNSTFNIDGICRINVESQLQLDYALQVGRQRFGKQYSFVYFIHLSNISIYDVTSQYSGSLVKSEKKLHRHRYDSAELITRRPQAANTKETQSP